MKSNNKFNTELYNWEFKKLNDKHYQWKRNNFKIETTYFKEKNKIKVMVFSLNEILYETSEKIISNPTIETIRRVSQRIASKVFNSW